MYTMTVEEGWYSIEEMGDDLGWSESEAYSSVDPQLMQHLEV